MTLARNKRSGGRRKNTSESLFVAVPRVVFLIVVICYVCVCVCVCVYIYIYKLCIRNNINFVAYKLHACMSYMSYVTGLEIRSCSGKLPQL